MGNRKGWAAEGDSCSHLKHDLLFCAAKLLVVTQGKTVVLGKEGGSAELPCESTSRRSASFAWKSSDQKTILGYKNKLLIKGKIPCPPNPGRKTVS